LACGEYGERTERPHYHLCLFNCGFDDERAAGKNLTESTTLNALWGNGAARIAPFTPATASYIASYLVKHGRRTYADEHGELRAAPFLRASKRPAIGRQWLEKHYKDLQHGFLITANAAGKATQQRIPRYYTQQLLRLNTQRTEDLKATAKPATDKGHPDRLKAAQQIHQQQQEKKGRKLE